MIDFGALFAFCDLHVSRCVARRTLDLTRYAVMTDFERETLGPGPRYYDRAGFPIPAILEDHPDGRGWIMPTLVWAEMRERESCIVAVDALPDGSRLSTVWLGLDHGFGGRPLIFETMRFAAESVPVELPSGGVVDAHPDLDFPDPFGAPGEMTNQLRYTTEEEALAAHHEIVRRIVLTTGH